MRPSTAQVSNLKIQQSADRTAACDLDVRRIHGLADEFVAYPRYAQTLPSAPPWTPEGFRGVDGPGILSDRCRSIGHHHRRSWVAHVGDVDPL